VNPRLYRDQLSYIMNHADDGYVFADLTFVPLLEALAPLLPRVRGYVILTGEDTMPPTTLPGALCYETLIGGRPTAIDWPLFDEYTASGLCYTSGTTAIPKACCTRIARRCCTRWCRRSPSRRGGARRRRA